MKYITIVERPDGFGAQFQTIIYAILIADNDNNEYIHIPIKSMQHNYDNDPHFLSKIEEIMNVYTNYKCIDDVESKSDIQTLGLYEAINKFEANINFYLESNSLKNLKAHFWENKSREFFKNNKFNVAVHIRRPNVHDVRIEGADEALEYYFNIINTIRNKCAAAEKEVLFHIYSQNEISDYADIVDNNITDIQFHLNENIYDTFIGMVAAEALVTSASSLSYTAALLSDGEIYYKPFWHCPKNTWIVC